MYAMRGNWPGMPGVITRIHAKKNALKAAT